MKYYRLFKPANNSIGGVFAHCTEKELDWLVDCFVPDKTEEISKNEYEMEREREHRKSLRMATGYPKR